MKMTTSTARRLLRETNPVSAAAFADAARDEYGQATLAAILDGSAASTVSAGADVTPEAAGAVPDGAGAQAGRGAKRLAAARRRWRVVVPATALTATLAAGLAIALLTSSGPAPGNPPAPDQAGSAAFAALVANLTAHPSAAPDSASAEWRRLADVAAAQPTPALGPVVYTKTQNWGLDLGAIHYGLGYRSHETNTEENWTGSDGAYLRVVTYPGGKVPPGIIPLNTSPPSADGKKNYAKYGPASLPTTESLMRQRLLQECRSGPCPTSDETYNLVINAMELMGSEPMPPAARAATLRVLADAAASRGPRRAFFNLGNVADRAGHKAVAIAFEYQRASLTTTCPGSQSASASGSSSSGKVSVTCSAVATTPGGASSASSSVATSGSAGGPTSRVASGTSGQAPARGTSPLQPPELWVLVFDPNTGALLGEEFAYCSGSVTGQLAAGRCTPESYAQLLEIKAVASVPPPPPGSTPNTPPVTGAP
jgi:hypothetical protein